MTGGGDIIKNKGDKIAEMKSLAGDVSAVVTQDPDADPSITRVQFVQKDYRVSQKIFKYSDWLIEWSMKFQNFNNIDRLWKVAVRPLLPSSELVQIWTAPSSLTTRPLMVPLPLAPISNTKKELSASR